MEQPKKFKDFSKKEQRYYSKILKKILRAATYQNVVSIHKPKKIKFKDGKEMTVYPFIALNKE